MSHGLSMTSILDVFTQRIEGLSGNVSDTFSDGFRLFARSLLPYVKEVRPDDRMQGGIAIRATESAICVHPYLFREVCRNGAIMAHSVESLQVTYTAFTPPEDVVESIDEAIVACSDRLVFASAVSSVRRSVNANVDLAITMLSVIPELPDSIKQEILARCFDEPEPTRFSLMNAVTSVARETRDPELRWKLEELGGGIGAAILPDLPSDCCGLEIDARSVTSGAT